MQNNSQMQPQSNNWPMHMGFNQNSNDGGFNHNLPPQQQQHKSSGMLVALVVDGLEEIIFFDF